MSKTDIKKNMQVFLLPKHTKAHGRPIYHKEAAKCGLNIEFYNPHSPIWDTVYELNVRSSDYVLHSAAKMIETSQGSSYARAPSVDGG